MTRTQQKSLPISRHRLFVPGLALWFGALFGLSSVVVRTSLFEAMVVASGLDRVVPATAPPLGHAARLLLALAFAVIGAAIGWAVAKAIAATHEGLPVAAEASHQAELFDPQPIEPEPLPQTDTAYQVRARDAHPDAPARRPILAREELRHAEFAAPIQPAPVQPLQAEPMPVEPMPVEVAPPVAAPVAPADVVEPAPAVVTPEPAPVASAPPLAGDWADEAPVLGPARDGAAEPAEQAPVLAPAHLGSAVVADDTPPAPVVAPVAAPSAAQRIAGAAPAELSHVELIERLALAMQRREAAAQPAAPLEDRPDAAGSLRAALDSLKGTGRG